MLDRREQNAVGSPREEAITRICLKGHRHSVTGVVIIANGRRALSGSWDDSVRLWDLERGKELRSFIGHTGAIRSVAFSPDGQRALSGSHDRTVRLWDVRTGKAD